MSRKSPWRRSWKAGSWASLCSSAAIVLGSRCDTGHAAAATNATSQWVFGERAALEQDRASGRFTLTGYAIHHAMSVFWASVHQRLQGPAPTLASALLSSSAVAATAAFVDLKLMPPRFTPGFEKRLSQRSLLAVYAAFAAGLAAASFGPAADPPAARGGRDADVAGRRPGS